MRRLLAVLTALFLASPAIARVAFVYDRSIFTSSSSGAYRAEFSTSVGFGYSIAKSFIEKYNPGSTDLYTSDQARTQSVAGGVIRGIQYDAIIWLAANGPSYTNNTHHVGCAPCSLSLGNASNPALPTVPHLFLSGAPGAESGGFLTAATCSTGASGAGYDPGSQGPDHWDMRYHLIGSAQSWPGTAGMNPAASALDLNNVTQPAGTFRVILGTDGSNTSSGLNGSTRRLPRPGWRDSLQSWNAASPWNGGYTQWRGGSPSYGFAVWARYMDHLAGTKPLVFCTYAAHHSSPVGGGDSDPTDTRNQPDPVPIYIAIAFLDSLTNGAVLGTSPAPAKLAVQVSGGFRRGLKSGPGGFAPYDTMQVKAALDSTAQLGIPITVGSNVDSLSAYASDLAIWKRVPGVRFTMESWTGVAGTAAAADSAVVSGNASTSRYTPLLVDPFGRMRRRQYYGPYPRNAQADSTADTTLYAMLRRGREMLGVFTGGDLDNVLIAAQDDFSPVTSTRWRNVFEDSLAFVAAKAGWSGISQNADDSINVTVVNNPIGFSSNQHRLTTFDGKSFMFLTHPGFNPRGSTYSGGVSGTFPDSGWSVAYTKRSLTGLFQPFWEFSQKYPWLKNVPPAAMVNQWTYEPGIHAEISPRSNIKTGVNLVRVTASGFGSGDLTTNPDMPAFYTLKYLKNQVDAINSFGRQLIVFVYPGDLEEKDIRR